VGALFQGGWGLSVFALLTAVSLLPMNMGILESPATFARPPSTLVANFVFVLFGWGLYTHRDVVDRFVPRAWIFSLLGLVFFVAHMACVVMLMDGKARFLLPSAVFAALSIWLFVYGLIGLFLRYAGRPSRVMRYIADASYWCYLVHLPLIAWLSILMAGWQVHTIVKFSVVLVATTTICVVTYDYWVRATAIGEWINGRRHPRWKAGRKIVTSEDQFPGYSQ
jgi:peptidoglycan/LPS O-acetylase OafA/YrhL